MIFMCIPLVTNDIELLFICLLTIWASSFYEVSMSFAHFPLRFQAYFLLICRCSVYILGNLYNQDSFLFLYSYPMDSASFIDMTILSLFPWSGTFPINQMAICVWVCFGTFYCVSVVHFAVLLAMFCSFIMPFYQTL